MYPSSSPSLVNTAAATTKMTPTRTKTKCWNCGNGRHPKVDYPAKDTVCFNCKRIGHFSKMCRSSNKQSTSTNQEYDSTNSTIAADYFYPTIFTLDNVNICGKTQEAHDKNLKEFLEVAKRKNLAFNKGKCIFSARSLSILGSVVGNGEIKPDPERLRPLKEIPSPHDQKSMKRIIGFFVSRI